MKRGWDWIRPCEPTSERELQKLKVKEFKYLGTTITNNNDWSTEIISRIHKAERA